jgi:hypothetical protein
MWDYFSKKNESVMPSISSSNYKLLVNEDKNIIEPPKGKTTGEFLKEHRGKTLSFDTWLLEIDGSLHYIILTNNSSNISVKSFDHFSYSGSIEFFMNTGQIFKIRYEDKMDKIRISWNNTSSFYLDYKIIKADRISLDDFFKNIDNKTLVRFGSASTLWEIEQSNTNYVLNCNGKKSFICTHNVEDDYYFHMDSGHTFRVFVMNNVIHIGSFYGNKENILKYDEYEFH